MNVAVGVVSPSAAWVLPRHYVDQLRRDFPQHTFLEAWDRDALRRMLSDSDVAFAAFVDQDLIPSLSRLRWVQAPAAGIGHLLSPELAASSIILTSARGICPARWKIIGCLSSRCSPRICGDLNAASRSQTLSTKRPGTRHLLRP